jgi:hypothetical protein
VGTLTSKSAINSAKTVHNVDTQMQSTDRIWIRNMMSTYAQGIGPLITGCHLQMEHIFKNSQGATLNVLQQYITTKQRQTIFAKRMLGIPTGT